ncbi:EAL domain-containing protein [Devosia rhodophyticola]|uniref:EAL domain-containing protein n=1 Tax=Devosia rhodophyticola TaxID=3026423 RepID=A0ABY7YSZ0_9HYPH|nr:EAL domain-containing protein [Devosia rhodophyticola]WDR04421.1 EAL domain-containing protein [Devosia rhodophyticola]
MLTSARKSLPTLDYVSIVRSVYGDRRALLFGAFASAAAAGLSAYRSQSFALFLIAVAFVAVGFIRYHNMRAFWRAAIDSEDVEAAEYWEIRATIGGGMVALVYGLWCLVSMLLVSDPYAELVSISLSMAAMVGVCARNFGLDRLVAIQTVLLSVPLAMGLFFRGDFYHPVLAGLLVIMLISFRKLATDIRTILLSAVHGRVEASRLAGELDMAMRTLQHGLCMLDEQGRVRVANDRAVRLLGLLGIDNMIGANFTDVAQKLSESDIVSEAVVRRLMSLVAKRGTGKILLCLPGDRYCEVTISSRRTNTVLLFEDISERVAAEERINYLARHDGLTGLPNRTHFTTVVAEDLQDRREAASLGAPDRIVALTIVDIDDFKHVNDALGHVVGDQLLKEAGRRLREAVGSQCTLARLGGDEFIIYRNQMIDPTEAEQDAEAILRAFAQPFALVETAISVNVSVGVVVNPPISDDLDGLMAKADLALYAAKGDGKARSQIFHAQMDVDYHYRQRLKADLQEAITNGALTLAFQPLLDLATNKVVCCEALARWDHPSLGSISPTVFIPLAEETGLITDITNWVLSAAARQCQNWPADISVAVNISARDFRGGDVGQMVTNALETSGLAAHRLEIEVTESALIEERDLAQAVLDMLVERGIGIALDDFGTGYSSLSYLQALPFSKLKIDRSFVADIATNPRSRRLLANVARLGRDLDLTVVAEGIETAEQLKVLQDYTSVDLVQGFLFGRPLAASGIGALIDQLNDQTFDNFRKHG